MEKNLNTGMDSIGNKPIPSEPIEISWHAALEKIDILESKIAELEAELSTHQSFGHPDMRRDIKALDQEVRSAKAPSTPKQEARLKKLDAYLFSLPNCSASFSDIGKKLELGFRSDKKNYRRQAMNKFGKVLESYPEKYIVEPGKIKNGKRVRLHPDWKRSLSIKRDKDSKV